MSPATDYAAVMARCAEIVRGSVEKGLLMFSPVGKMGGTVKIAPPLNLTPEACDDSLAAFQEALAEAVAARRESLAPATASS